MTSNVLDAAQSAISSSNGGSYEEQDFRALYEREYHAHQRTQTELARVRNHAQYLESKITKLEGDIALLKKLLFSRNDEKRPIVLPPASVPEASTKKHGAQPGHPAHTRKIPYHLPTREVLHALPSAVCSCCGLPLQELHSDEVSYEVTLESQYTLIRHRRKKYRKTCHCPQPLVTAPAPPKLFPGGLYSMEFWIQVLVDKYAFGMPLERQASKMQTENLTVSTGVLCDGLQKTVALLEPLYELMLQNIAFEKLIHADETRWWNWAACYQQDAALKQHWLWGFFSASYHVFVISPSRGANVVKDALGQGEQQTIVPIIVCDRHKAYRCANTLAYCWAHVRRDFLNLQTKYPNDKAVVEWAQTWLQLIQDLYALHALRLQQRDKALQCDAYQKQLQTTLDSMQPLMDARHDHPAQIAQSKSMREHWVGLTRFLDDPEIPLDNNLAERGLRTPVVGRKNYYGTHSDQSTRATAIAYSILSTCKLHRLDPKKFLLRYLTAQIPRQGAPPQGTHANLQDCLPHRYAQIHPEDQMPK